MNKDDFLNLSTLDQHKVIAAHRAGRTNLACLRDVFGEVPNNATSFHTYHDKAIFLNGTSTESYEPVLQIDLDENITHQLRMVGMLGTFGWEIRTGGSVARMIEKLAENNERRT